MVYFYKLRFASNERQNTYSQGHAVNTAIIGDRAAVGETRGTLIILKSAGGAGPTHEPYSGPLIPGQTQRVTLIVPDQKSPIEVDAILCDDSSITVEAILANNKYRYDTIKVYSIGEVEIL